MPDARKKKKKGKRKDGDGLVIRYIQLRGEEKQIIASSLLSYLYLSLLRAYPLSPVNSFRSFPSRPVRNPALGHTVNFLPLPCRTYFFSHDERCGELRVAAPCDDMPSNRLGNRRSRTIPCLNPRHRPKCAAACGQPLAK